MNKLAGILATALLVSQYGDAYAEDLVAARNIRAGSIISASDIITPDNQASLRRAVEVIGMEAVRTLYRGQPIDAEKVRAPTLIQRNAVVQMEFIRGHMTIAAEGRALEKGSLGQRIRVINLGSKRTVSVVVTGTNSVRADS